MNEQRPSNPEVSQAPEPTSYVVEGNTYRKLIAERDAYRTVANDLARQLRKRTPADTSAPPERAAHEPPASRESEPQIVRGVAEQIGHYIVYGTPGVWGWLPEDHEAQHNCDAMGCGQDHALARFPITRTTEPPGDDLKEATRLLHILYAWYWRPANERDSARVDPLYPARGVGSYSIPLFAAIKALLDRYPYGGPSLTKPAPRLPSGHLLENCPGCDECTGPETRAPHYDAAANFARSCTVADPVDKECSYCFGEGAVSMSNGERRMCTLCTGTGRVPAESAPRSMFDGAPMKVVEWPAIPSKPSSDK